MPRERLSMRKIREVLRLKHECQLAYREIARSCGLARSTVSDYLARAAEAGLGWPLPPTLSDQDLEARLFHRAELEPKGRPRPQPDYAAIEEELRQHRRLNLTLDLLWREYKAQHPDGYQYTQFVAHYHRWRRQRDVCLRQTHRYGEKLFVDFAEGLALVDPQTGARTPTALFVAVWAPPTTPMPRPVPDRICRLGLAPMGGRSRIVAWSRTSSCRTISGTASRRPVGMSPS